MNTAAAPTPTAPRVVDIGGVPVWVQGQGPVLVFLHGWPDGPALWEDTVLGLQGTHTCVRVTLPGFDLARPPQPSSVDAICAFLRTVVDTVSPGLPVTLVLHDWGCFFGYEYAARHSDRVARVVGVDVGDTNSSAYLRGLTLREKVLIAGYQLWLAVAWSVGPHWPGLAQAMTHWMARQVGCRSPAHTMGWQMNYPYAMQWWGAFGGLRGVARAHRVLGPVLPTLFVYGRRKPFMFHSQAWLDQLAATPGCAAEGLDAGHWLMRQQPERFLAVLRAWLDQPAAPPKPKP